jgi:hypothetical protein
VGGYGFCHSVKINVKNLSQNCKSSDIRVFWLGFRGNIRGFSGYQSIVIPLSGEIWDKKEKIK